MAKNREQILQEIRNWNGYLSDVKNIPVDPQHKYVDENDIYERLHTYLKGYVEKVFGVYTDAQGVFKSVAEDELSDEQKEWREATQGKLSLMYSDWYNVALKGDKKGFLPAIENVNGPEKAKKIQQDIRYEMDEKFFPAYRALRDSFSKRWWFEWIFNHKQYVAERDAVKVMGNLMKSIGGFTKQELDRAYENNKTIITQEDLYPTKAVKEPKPVKEVAVKAKAENSLEKFKQLDNDEKVFYPRVMKDLYKGMQGDGIINIDAARKSLPVHIYAPLAKLAENLCKFDAEYGAGKESDPAKYKADLSERIANTAMSMFEAAFKAFNAVDPMTNRFVFGEMSLKDRIISAQNATDVMLKNLTPVGFDQKNFGNLARGSYFLDNMQIVRAFLMENFAGKYNETEIDAAMTEARTQLGVSYRGERMEMPQVYQVNYRPNINNLKLEAKAINEALKLVNGENPVIKDEALKMVINNNIKKFKQVKQEEGAVVTYEQKAKIMEKWVKAEQNLAKMYPNYDPKAAQAMVSEAVGANAPEKVNVNLNEPKAQIVPPVEQPPVAIEAPKAER